MTDFAALGTYNTDDTLTEGELRAALEDQLRATLEFAGAGPAVLHQIGVTGGTASDTITPASAQPSMVKLQPQTGTEDDLNRILQTNTRDGQLLYLRVNSDSYRVHIKSGGASPGNIVLLYGETEYLLSHQSQVSCFERQGSSWREIKRSGIEARHAVGAAGEPGWGHANWSGSSAIDFWKDGSGYVCVEGQAINLTSASTNFDIFSLTAGWRPLINDVNFAVWDETSQEVAIIRITLAGIVRYVGDATQTRSTSVLLHLDPLRFRVQT